MESKIVHKDLLKEFFSAVKNHKLLIIIDSASKDGRAIFSLVSYKKGKYVDYFTLLRELGFKNYKDEPSLFVTYCAGRFSLYILDNIGIELKEKGVRLPKYWYDEIQRQNVI